VISIAVIDLKIEKPSFPRRLESTFKKHGCPIETLGHDDRQLPEVYFI